MCNTLKCGILNSALIKWEFEMCLLYKDGARVPGAHSAEFTSFD